MMASLDVTTDTPRSRRRSLRLPKLPRLGVEQTVSLVAAVLVPLGVVVVLLGWYGAAHTPYVFEQIPYMISGGLLGVGLLFAGAALYVGTWFARAAAQQRAAHAELLEAIGALREDLGRRGSGLADTTEIPIVGARRFVATPTGTMFHLRDCAVVADRDDVRVVDPHAEDLQPCKLCEPLGDGRS